MKHKTDQQYLEIGRRIKTRRKELGWNQMYLAEKIGISNNHMSAIETGREHPSLDTFLKICAGLKTTPDYLLLGSVHVDDIPANILADLHLCNKADLPVIQDIINIYVQRGALSPKSNRSKK